MSKTNNRKSDRTKLVSREPQVHPIFSAIDRGDVEEVRRLLQAEPRAALATIPGPLVGPDTPLHAAAHLGHLEIAELLLRHGADVNARGDGGDTPLHEAANNGHVEVVELLLKHGADIEAEDASKAKPLHLCTPGRDPHFPRMAQVLLQHGARLDLHSALGLLDTDWVRQLLRDDLDVVAKDPRAHDLLPGVVATVARKIDQRLEKQGAGKHTDHEVWLRISQQVVTEDMDILETLIARKAPAERRGLWAIRSAMEVADVRVVQRLLEYGVPKPSERDPLWMTTKLHLPQNPCRHELEALFRKHWGEFWG
jgi:hypothetical protein